MNDYLGFAKELAQEAGEIMMRHFRAEDLTVEYKADRTPVTLADNEINRLVIEKVKEKYPDHGVLGEEESLNLEKGSIWIVDPLDGTPNFARKIPPFAFSLALVIGGELKVGVVYEPLTDRLLCAAAGKGAYENGKKLDISQKKLPGRFQISSWVIGGIDNSVFSDKSILGEVADLYAQTGIITAMDLPVAYALAVVAADSLDGIVSTIKTPWDVAAGSLIAIEAGAKVTDLFGNEVKDWTKPANGILAASPDIHHFLSDTISPALEKRRQ